MKCSNGSIATHCKLILVLAIGNGMNVTHVNCSFVATPRNNHIPQAERASIVSLWRGSDYMDHISRPSAAFG